MQRIGIERLTSRQREVLGLIAKGLTNEEIGGVLAISLATVRTHITAILATLNVANRTEAAWAFHTAEVSASPMTTVLERPAIAVLPLLALDDDPRASAVARAISHDLANLFACSCWFPVIAQVSTAQARTLGATSQQIARALGARFLVDGSLRMHGDHWRLTVEIDDAESGHCIWSERNDFAVRDLFAVQDAFCSAIVANAYPVLVKRVALGLRRLPLPADLAAWELVHHAMDLCGRREQAAAAHARSLCSVALARDPTQVLAHFGQGLIAYDELLNQWIPDEEGRDRLFAAATCCIELAPHAAEGYFLQARYFQTRGDHARAVPLLALAVAHNPSFAQAHALLAQTLHLAGRSEEGLASMRHALRLGPRAFVAGLALLHFMRAEYADALAAAENAVSVNPRYTFARVLAATSAHWSGERTRADEHVRRLCADYPPFMPARMLRVFGPEVEVVQQITGALAALGVRP